jgi:hypothetical protein
MNNIVETIHEQKLARTTLGWKHREVGVWWHYNFMNNY